LTGDGDIQTLQKAKEIAVGLPILKRKRPGGKLRGEEK